MFSLRKSTCIGCVMTVVCVNWASATVVHIDGNNGDDYYNYDEGDNDYSPNSLISRCSLSDRSNGVLCDCGFALQAACPNDRHGGLVCMECVEEANVTTLNGTICPDNIKEAFCGGCADGFDAKWLNELPPRNNTNITMSHEEFDLCRHGLDLTNASGLVVQQMQIHSCDDDMIAAYYLGLGYDNIYHQIPNNTFIWLHGDSLDRLIKCCNNYKTPSFKKSCAESLPLEAFWALLKAATHCDPDAIENELESIGLDLTNVDGSNVFGGLYGIDVRKLSSIVTPLIVYGFHELYSLTIEFLTGVTTAAAVKHGCGDSWFVPGADQLYSTTYNLQGSFYFPRSDPSPYEATGTCGKSASSEVQRLDVCTNMAKFLEQKAGLSGMNIVLCAVDCSTPDHIPAISHLQGTFVAATFVVVEISTNPTGLGQKHDGLEAAVLKFMEGYDVKDNLDQTIATGYDFVYKRMFSEELTHTMMWNNMTSRHLNVTESQLLPNMTEAMLAYQPGSHNQPTTSASVIIAAVVPSALLVGVIIGVCMRRNQAHPTRVMSSDGAAHVNINHHYEDVQSLTLPDQSEA
eukprot:m.27592 g.27592  ORF g.27592 m.27592 type:complete len:573 (+) comp15772_c0_seq1:153-1871(+)